jgi:hypothetical protein
VAIETFSTSIVENSFDLALSEGAASWSDDEIRSVTCESCGAQLIFDTHTKAQFCTYCGSSHIQEQSVEKTIPPAYLVPFSIASAQAYEAFKTWLTSRWFAPNDLKQSYKNNRLIGTYVPYWTYDAETYSHYTAQRGDHYYVTKTRTVNGKTETYQEQHTRWTNVSGAYDQSYDDILVCASSKIERSLATKIQGFDQQRLVSYLPDYLSGFLAERYSIDLKDGWELGRQIIDDRLNSEIRSTIGGDEIRLLNIHSEYDNVTFKHLLLPLWLSSYTYKQKLYHFMINGQSGAVSGEYPKSPLKIALAILGGCLVVALLYYLYITQIA